ncbi:YdcF family protein [Anaerospora hongkongensis]|uniref:YdcF family protein n=1 Tax=Anaerospora hongkongensis TaxID=244830 RepID=UPI0028989E86|nr:YdcF family protein [Anaerospora hongkongensis]
MLYVLKVIYNTLFIPPGIFLSLLLALAARTYRSQRKTAVFLFAFTILFYFCTISAVADPVIRSLESRYTPPAVISGDVIVLLGGGATLDTPNLTGPGHLSGYAANRLLTAAQLYHKYRLPILVSGGKVLETSGTEAELSRILLLDLNVPDEKILVENQSLNTSQNAVYSKKLLDFYGFNQPILVTSAFHMPRAVLQFQKVGSKVIPYPTDYQANVHNLISWFDFIPSSNALTNIALTTKEYLGLAAIHWY